MADTIYGRALRMPARFTKWVRQKKGEYGFSNAEIGKTLNKSSQEVGRKLKTNNFDLRDVIAILNLFGATEEDLPYLFITRRDK